jgi:hypothetical protein
VSSEDKNASQCCLAGNRRVGYEVPAVSASVIVRRIGVKDVQQAMGERKG